MTYSTQEIVDKGEFIERWIIDVDENNELQSNGSQEFAYKYNNNYYVTWMNWDDQPINPDEMLQPADWYGEVTE